ncbi:MAG: tetratricopeptide repeat protein [Desulfuromonadales bacterium]|nr:tetratricopeptide repeat protein [Desulfuromonadales bacterium]
MTRHLRSRQTAVGLLCALVLLLWPAASSVARDVSAPGNDTGRQDKESATYAELRQASLERPEEMELIDRLALAAYAAGDYETAAMTFERLLIFDPDSDRARLQLARSYARLGMTSLATEYLRDLQGREPSAETAKLLEKSLAALKIGNTSVLLDQFDALLKPFTRPFLPARQPVTGSAVHEGSMLTAAVGSVVALRGTALAERSGDRERPLLMKSPVFSGDRITTSIGSRLQVAFVDDSLVSLGPGAEMVIEEYVWDPQTTKGSMKTVVEKGLFRVLGGQIAKSSPERFHTDTPAATIGVHGSFYAGFQNAGTGNLQVAALGGEGGFVVNPLGRTGLTEPGIAASSAPGQAPSPARPVSTTELHLFAEGLSDDLILHHKAVACLEDYSAAFAEEPFDCDQVCFTCHKDDELGLLSSQLQNQQDLRTDEAYPGLYPTAIPISKDNSYTDNWAALPMLQKVCRDCHAGMAIEHGNHPLFEDVTFNDQGELQVIEGMLVCTSCHEPHSKQTPLLRASNERSRVCLACHHDK